MFELIFYLKKIKFKIAILLQSLVTKFLHFKEKRNNRRISKYSCSKVFFLLVY